MPKRLPPSSSGPSANPLLVRGQALRLTEAFLTLPSPSRIEKKALSEALEALNDRATICQVLVKELVQAPTDERRNRLGEILMAVGSVKLLQDPLWELIMSPTASDTLKDTAHLILRQLGDETDPNLFLEYLEDPEALIGNETARMLAQAQTNPEAMVDFVDFVLSLPVGEQLSLLQSLANEYPVAHQARLWEALWAYQPDNRVAEWLEKTLLEGDDISLAPVLERLGEVEHPNHTTQAFAREARKRHLKWGATAATRVPHPITQTTTLDTGYATLPDGMGNQAFLVTRRHANGDICLMAVALHQTQGILDCFGFYQLSDAEVGQLVKKFHTTTLQVPLPPSDIAAWLHEAQKRTTAQQRPLPYEFTLWQALLDDVTPTPHWPDPLHKTGACFVTTAWQPITHQLYLHPDFDTWFLEERDSELAAWLCEQTLHVTGQALSKAANATPNQSDSLVKELVSTLETLGEAFLPAFWASDDRHLLADKLLRAAYLLNHAQAQTFSKLAYSEVAQLQQPAETPIETPFLRAYIRRSIAECLLRVVRYPQQHPWLQSPAGEAIRPQLSVLQTWTDIVYSQWFPTPDEGDPDVSPLFQA
ncbi:MAG: hypothetical protein U0003_02075 [Vampirovibrionales bacterium]